jgi:hypothetical protein
MKIQFDILIGLTFKRRKNPANCQNIQNSTRKQKLKISPKSKQTDHELYRWPKYFDLLTNSCGIASNFSEYTLNSLKAPHELVTIVPFLTAGLFVSINAQPGVNRKSNTLLLIFMVQSPILDDIAGNIIV